MTHPPLHPDDLRDARAADRFNAWLDGTDQPGPPDLVPVARAIDRVAGDGLPASTIRRHEQTLWEELMRQVPMPAPVTIPVALPVGQSSMAVARPAPLRRAGSRVMGLVATRTLVLLIALSAVAVYLSLPQSGDDPTMTLAALGGASPSATTPIAERTPVRPDATVITTPAQYDVPPMWSLPPVSAYDLPVLDILGVGWSPLVGSHYLFFLAGTDVQAEAHTYVDNQGNRVRTIVAYFPENGAIEEARDWVEREIAIYQDSLYPRGGSPNERIVSGALEGCTDLSRTEGAERITSFSAYATGCFSDDDRMMVFVSVSGRVLIPTGRYPINPADSLVAAILEAIAMEAAPVAGS